MSKKVQKSVPASNRSTYQAFRCFRPFQAVTLGIFDIQLCTKSTGNKLRSLHRTSDHSPVSRASGIAQSNAPVLSGRCAQMCSPFRVRPCHQLPIDHCNCTAKPRAKRASRNSRTNLTASVQDRTSFLVQILNTIIYIYIYLIRCILILNLTK